jgi:capsular exopolysaccharide synthesis family protein
MNISEKDTSALKLYGQAFWRRRFEFLATVFLFLSALTIYTLKQPKVYESSLLLLIGKQQKPQVVNQERMDNVDKGDSGELDTEVQVLRTLPLVSKATTVLKPQYYNLEPRAVVDELTVQQLGKAGIISVAYRDSDPKRLLDVLSQLGKTYVDFSLTNRRSQFTNAIQFIEKKLPPAQKSLAARSKQLATFRKRNNLINPNEVGSTLTKALAELGEQERATVADVRKGQALYKTLQQRIGFLPPNRALALASLNQDPNYLALLKDYQEAEKQRSLEQLRFREKAPQSQLLQGKRNKIDQLLARQVRRILGDRTQAAQVPRLNELQITQVGQFLDAQNNLNIQQARLRALQGARFGLEKKFKLVPDLQQEYDALFRQVQVESDNVTRLLSKLEEFRILEAQESPTWQIIQPPVAPEKPISPDLRLNLMVGSVLALMLGAFVVYLREQLDKRLRSADSVSEMLHLRTLSIIPETDKMLLHLNSFPSEDISEQLSFNSSLRLQWLYFQASLQNLLFTLRSMGATESLKAIGITSSTPREGKSTIVRHLGLCAAELGCRVLLIDGDLRKPELHLGFKVSNTQGLSTIIRDNLPWQEVIQETTHPGLHLLTAGPMPSNPVVVLDSPKMKQLMTQLRYHYDLILMDLPPVFGFTDSLAAANQLDGLVLLVGLNQATRETLKVSLEPLSYAHKQPIGVVCNTAKVSDVAYSAYPRYEAPLGNFRHQFTQNQFVRRLMGNSPQRNDNL